MDAREQAIGFSRCTSCEDRQRHNHGVTATLCEGCRDNKRRIEILIAERDDARRILVEAMQKLEDLRELRRLHIAF